MDTPARWPQGHFILLDDRSEGKGEKIRAILEGISDELGGRPGKNPQYDPEREQEVPGPKIA